METKDIFKNNNIADLERELSKNREDLRKFRFAVIQAKVKNVKQGFKSKKVIARILTRIGQLKKS